MKLLSSDSTVKMNTDITHSDNEYNEIRYIILELAPLRQSTMAEFALSILMLLPTPGTNIKSEVVVQSNIIYIRFL